MASGAQACDGGGGGGLENVPPEEQGDDVLAIGTVPETPSPGELSAQQAAAAAAAHAARRGGGGGSGAGRQFVDNTPSKGCVAKDQAWLCGHQRVEGEAGGGAGAGGVCAGLPSTYSEVAAPTTLKAAFLEPMCDELATDVALGLFAKTDSEFMAMFTAAGALSTLQTKRDAGEGD
ncbi:MAG: hypothetical protein J3K34DRAFT_476649 [Monoraphidium minutum]|nr:MAG: hypothetical protein J3K34DRAFT_476649 [Monoraphidium minutum]